MFNLKSINCIDGWPLQREPNDLFFVWVLRSYVTASDWLLDIPWIVDWFASDVTHLIATIHEATFRARFCSNRLRQRISCGNGLLRQLSMVFSRLNILSRVARNRMTASLTFGQKNICGQLKLLASCSKVFEVTWYTKCNKKVRITPLTKKMLRLQIAGTVDSVYTLTRLAHPTSSCCKWLPQRKFA